MRATRIRGMIVGCRVHPRLTAMTTRMTVFVSKARAILRGTAVIEAKYGGLRFESGLLEM